MKTILNHYFKYTFIMKTLKATLFACLVLVVGACKDDDDETSAVSNDEAAEMIASSLSESSSGLTVMVDASASVTGQVVDEYEGGRVAACGYENNASFTSTSPQGAAVTYSYAYTYHYLLTCEAGAPKTMEAAVTYDGQFDGPRISSAHEGTAEVLVTKLESSSTTYSVDASYEAEGTFQSKIRNKNSTSSSVDISLDAVVVDKETREILSGSASATITGTVTGKGSFTFTGTIVFKGDHLAEVTVNGNKYLVNLVSGDVTAQ